MNSVVDAHNLLSLESGLPVGLYDPGKLLERGKEAFEKFAAASEVERWMVNGT